MCVYERNKNTATRRQTIGGMICSSNVLFINVDDFAVRVFAEGRNSSFLGVEAKRSFVTSLRCTLVISLHVTVSAFMFLAFSVYLATSILLIRDFLNIWHAKYWIHVLSHINTSQSRRARPLLSNIDFDRKGGLKRKRERLNYMCSDGKSLTISDPVE